MQYDNKHNRLNEFDGNDNDIFRCLYMKYFPKVKYFINYFVKSEVIAEDLAQDIFEYIWMNRGRLFNLESLSAYLFRMAKNASINYLSHETIEKDYIASYAVSPEHLTDDEIYAKELELLIQLVVEKMPKQRRQIFVMSRFKHLKNAEIAAQLNLSQSTVQNHLNLALKQIREVVSLSLIFFL